MKRPGALGASLFKKILIIVKIFWVASQFTTSTWDVGAQELCSVVLIIIIIRTVDQISRF